MAALLLALASMGSAHGLEAGAAKVAIPIPPGVPLDGLLERWGQSHVAVHDPVYVRCLYLRERETSIFLLTADLYAISRELRARVLDLAPDVVPTENIILAATHNHSGPGGLDKRWAYRLQAGRYMPEFVESAAKAFAEAMVQAHGNARRLAAIACLSTASQGLATNRFMPDGPSDPTMGIIRVDDADGAPIAILAVSPAPPMAAAAADRTQISAGYPGVFVSQLEALAGGDCVGMFLCGATADQKCANPGGKAGWDWPAALGASFAAQVHEAAQDIVCGQSEIHLFQVRADLPPSLAGPLLPDSTTLLILEIGDSLLLFAPGMPSSEIGQRLREQALARGYAAQFTICAANDRLPSYVSRSVYPRTTVPDLIFHGPEIEQWLLHEVARLIPRSQPGPETVPPDVVEPRDLGGGFSLDLSGPFSECGRWRGAAFRDIIQAHFRSAAGRLSEDHSLVPTTGLWQIAPPFVDLKPYLLPRLGMEARPLLNAISPSLVEEVSGLAEGCGLPFDAAWMLQAYTQAIDAGPHEAGHSGLFAAIGERAGADDLRVGQNINGVGFGLSPGEHTSLVAVRYAPDQGHGFVAITMPWALGPISGMNDAGLVLCAERMNSQPSGSFEAPPIGLLLHDVLYSSGTFKEALSKLEASPATLGYRLLVAALSPARTRDGAETRPQADARILEHDTTRLVREPVDGLLIGTTASPKPEDAAEDTPASIEDILREKRIISQTTIQAVLADPALLLDEDTQCSVVFLPKSNRIAIAFRNDQGIFGEFVELAVPVKATEAP